MRESSDNSITVDPSRITATAATARKLSIALDLCLIALVIAWHIVAVWTSRSLMIGLMLTLPLWPPLYGMWRANRRTFAWATLCVIPYFVIGTTEAVANPATRSWAGACLALSLALFVSLIAYLRLTRPIVTSAQ